MASDEFRFHTGSIKRQLVLEQQPDAEGNCFDSILVRLKVDTLKKLGREGYRFDSILVRLKVYHVLYPFLCIYHVSIPYWFD